MNRQMNECLSRFTRKMREKITRKKAHRLKVKYYYICRKIENIIRRIFTLVIMSPKLINFFFSKVAFKIDLGGFTSLSWRLRTALKHLAVQGINQSPLLLRLWQYPPGATEIPPEKKCLPLSSATLISTFHVFYSQRNFN